MEKILNVLLSSRFKSFYWRAGVMIVTGFVALLAESVELFELGPQMTVFLGLALGELTKALNNLTQGRTLGFSK